MMTEYNPQHGHRDYQQHDQREQQHDYRDQRDQRQRDQSDPREQQQQQQQPRLTGLERGRSIKLMRNGDSFFSGRSFVINQRKYPMLEVFLDDASQALKANFGAVRCIYTPRNGTRLHDISELEDHRTYVAGGGEKFKRLQYHDIADGKRVQVKDRTPPRLPPVRRNDIEGRALKLSRSENVIIYVYRNGDPLTLPSKILLVKPTLQNWESVLDEITRKVSLNYSAVFKLYAMNGELITSAQQLEYNGMYVAAGKERFKRIEYPDPKTFSPNSSPKMSRKSYTKSDGTNTHTATTADSHGSYEHGGRRRPVREEYDFFNNKPHQPRRGPAKETDLDRDDGGIYKGRLNHRDRAREIDETRDTKVDLPVDHREVETIEEENVYGNGGGRKPRRPQQPQTQSKTNHAVANSRQRSPPVRSVKSPPKTYDNDDDDNNHNNKFGKTNGHHRSNNHHKMNTNGYDNGYHHDTPPISSQIDDDLDEQQSNLLNTKTNQEDEEHAATVIQSRVRGYLTRKHAPHEKPENTDQTTNNHEEQENTEQLTNNHEEQKNSEQLNNNHKEQENIEQLTSNHEEQQNTDQLIINQDQQQQQQQEEEAPKNENDTLNQRDHSPKTNKEHHDDDDDNV
ncbi:unnamed protein product [Adineta steineri]|uniref:Doublecortin domain-containing protein n=1 Tax=Adineta steineri TaxID=433720 RepID=A0A815F059_9BILA|nr:unnamed protein product [Adineta steineri]CAF3542201.1 unnamed protein product [Adineta steineri]